jgi:imidazolonepropionase-like amidohydrolase
VSATDAGFMPGLSMHYEMQMLSDIGVPPMKIIQGATLWGAESFGKAKDLGSVEPGKLADFMIVEGNPLADITATRNIRMVIKDGQVLDTTYDRRFLNPIPRRTGVPKG